MTVEELSNIVQQSLNSVDLEKLKEVKGASAKDVFLAILKLVSKDYIGAAETAIQTIVDYREGEFFRKYCRYLLELAETTPEQRHQFAQEIQEKADDFSGNVICGMVDRLDNINKEQVFAKLSVARIHGFISIEDFFRLHSLLERIPYVDLKELTKYKEPFYDETGDTELLFATGALELDSINKEDGNKYVLSRLGAALIRWGFGIHLELEHGKGTNVALDMGTYEDIDEMMNEKIKANRPVYKNETLYFPDGTKSGKEEDDGMFLYDLARGK
jgi:hypothetical protein